MNCGAHRGRTTNGDHVARDDFDTFCRRQTERARWRAENAVRRVHRRQLALTTTNTCWAIESRGLPQGSGVGPFGPHRRDQQEE